MGKKLTWGLAVAAIALVVLLVWRERAALLQARRDRIELLNRIAQDSGTSAHQIAIAGQLETLWRRRAEQGDVDLGAALKGAHRVGTALASLRLSFDSLKQSVAGTVALDTLGETALLGGAVDTNGFHVRAEVTVRGVRAVRPEIVTEWLWRIRRDPIVFDVSFACEGDVAVAHVIGPTWTTFDIRRAVQNDRVCNPLPRPFFSFKAPIGTLGAVFVLGVAVGVVVKK